MRVSSFGGRVLAVIIASALATMLASPAAATTGWLDPTFSGNGWVQLEGTHGGSDVVVAAGPNGRTVVGRETAPGEGTVIDAIVLTPGGAPLATFNGGNWRWMLDRTDSAGWPLFAATSGGGAIAAHGADALHNLPIREVDAAGDFVGTGGGKVLNGFNRANFVRLPGGSLRTCYENDSTGNVVLGFTAERALDPAVGPDGERPIPINCGAVGSDLSGHLYFGLESFGEPNGTLQLLRTTTSGVVDTGWSGDGQTIVARAGLGIDFPDRRAPDFAPDFNDAASPFVALADGSLLLAARATRDPAGETWSAAVIKLTPDGALDPTFDGDGIRAFGPEGGESWILAMAADSAGRAVVSVVYKTTSGRKAYLVRLTEDGRFDRTFGRSGRVQQTYGASGLAIDASDRILTAAWNGTRVVVARRNS